MWLEVSDIKSFLGFRVLVLYSEKSNYKKTFGKYGIIKNDSGDQLGVLLDDMMNPASGKGLFWYNRGEIKVLDKGEENSMIKLEGYKHLAVAETGSGNKEYFYALYDDTVQIGDLVAVTGNNGWNLLIKVKDVISIEAAKGIIAPKDIVSEVIGRVDTASYNKRVEHRKLAEQLRKQLFEKRKEIEARKDDMYYAEIDPEYAEIFKKLQLLSV